jgi:hypothetical protein
MNLEEYIFLHILFSYYTFIAITYKQLKAMGRKIIGG